MNPTLACLVGPLPGAGSGLSIQVLREGIRYSQSNIFVIYQCGDSSRLELIWELWRVSKKWKREGNQQEETGKEQKEKRNRQERK